MYSFSLKRFSLILLLGLFTVISCVDDDDFSVPPVACTDNFSAGFDFLDVFALNVTDGADLINIADTEGVDFDSIFEGYVVSSDRAGNFFATLVLQDQLTNPNRGLQIEIDLRDSYTQFPVGSKVFVNLNGLRINNGTGTTELGGLFEDGIGRLPQNQVNTHLFSSCDSVALPTPTVFTDISELLVEENLNTLIQLDSVQFVRTGNGETYFDNVNYPELGNATNIPIEDANGNTVVVRTSSFADFASEELPTGSGSLVGVLSAFSTDGSVSPSDYQIFIRDLSDVDMSGSRILDQCDPFTLGTETLPFAEDWSSYSVGDNGEPIVAPWTVYAEDGSRVFNVETFDGVNYAEMSAFRSGEENVTWLISPTVNMSEAESPVISFAMADAFQNGVALDLLYSTDFDGSNCPQNFTWNEIGDTEVSALFNNDGFFDNVYEFSGNLPVPVTSGNVVFAFRYSGGDGSITSTVQISEITIGREVSDVDPTPTCTPFTIPSQSVPFTDDFESYAEGDVSAPWTFFNEVGERAWDIREFGGNQYANMSSFSSTEANTTWLVSPRMNIDDMTDKVMSFTIQDAFQNGNPLQLMYSQDYDGSDCPTEFTWTTIGTSEIAALIDNSATFDGVFSPSGDIDLSSISGEAVFAFVYTGEDGVLTTTIQLDDVNFGVSQGGGGGGGSATSLPLNETFDSGIPSTWTVSTNLSGEQWFGNDFSGVFYAQMDAFAGSGNPIHNVRSWLVSPELDFDAQTGETMVLRIADAFSNGQPLRAFFSNDYDGSGNPEDFTWTEIGATEINALNTNTGSFDNIYEATSAIDLSGIIGTAYIGFLYDSAGGTISTTIQLDNVTIE